MRHNWQEMNAPDERQLLAGARRLDAKSLAAVYDGYSLAIYSYAMRLLGDTSIAEDCVSETFSRLLKALQHGQGPNEYLKAYLYRVAHNWITDYYRRQPPPSEELDEEMPDHAASPEHQAENQVMAERSRRALLLLPPEQREVVMLHFYEGMELEEIATVMGKTLGATKALQHRGLTALRKIFSEEEL
jgi:RNA polymerase sigma-70 factor, ECF subfamily